MDLQQNEPIAQIVITAIANAVKSAAAYMLKTPKIGACPID